MRIRSIKPEFYLHEELSKLPALTRILFTGLWGLADNAGILEDRPIRIKLQVLPYDDVDVDGALQSLADAGFIVRYEAEEERFIAIPKFLKHQVLQGSEAKRESKLPQPPKSSKQPKLKRRPAIPRNVQGSDLEEPAHSLECNWNENSFQGMSLESEKGLEREEEGKRKGTLESPVSAKPEPSATQALPESPPAPPEPNKPARQRNKLLDALVAATGGDPLVTTRPAMRAAGVALAEIRAVCPDLTPQVIDRAAKAYSQAHRDWPLTPSALAKHWHTLGQATAPSKPPDPLDPNGPEPSGNWRPVMIRIFDLNADALDAKKWAELPVSYRRETLRELQNEGLAGNSDAPRTDASYPRNASK